MQSNTTIAAPNDPQFQPPPADTISCIKFAPSPQALVCAAGWDGKAFVWEISPNGQNMGRAQTQLQSPILSVAWKNDIGTVFLGCGDKSAYAWDLHTNQTRPVAQCQTAIHEVYWCDQISHLATVGFDEYILFWNLNNTQPSVTLHVNSRIHSSAFQFPLLIVGLQNKQVAMWDLQRVMQGQNQPVTHTDTTIRHQITCISIGGDLKWFALGLLDGRVSVKSVLYTTPNSEPRISNDYSFKCHRDQVAHSINCIKTNPIANYFLTGASDNSIIVWSKNMKQRLRSYTQLGAPVTALDINMDGSLLVYATGYDWSKGITFASNQGLKIAYRLVVNEIKQ